MFHPDDIPKYKKDNREAVQKWIRGGVLLGERPLWSEHLLQTSRGRPSCAQINLCNLAASNQNGVGSILRYTAVYRRVNFIECTQHDRPNMYQYNYRGKSRISLTSLCLSRARQPSNSLQRISSLCQNHINSKYDLDVTLTLIVIITNGLLS